MKYQRFQLIFSISEKSRDIQGLKKLMMKLQFLEYGLKKIFRRFTAYIQQNDVFVGALTVEEHLFLQSKVFFSVTVKI